MEDDILNLDSKINIDCPICDKCCIGRGDLKITPINVLEIAKFFKISIKEVFEKYLEDAHSSKPEYVIKAVGDKRLCIFNDSQTNKCKIHKIRLMQCTMFPLVPYNIEFDLFKNSNECPVKSKKTMTVDKWVNGNGKIYNKHKKIYLKWINFIEEIEPHWTKYSKDKQDRILNVIYKEYNLHGNFNKQIEENLLKARRIMYLED